MKYWKDAEQLINRSPCLAIATVNEDGSPHITPIGSLFTNEKGKCFYFEKLPQRLRENLDRGSRFTILLQRGKLLYWLRALLKGKFDTMPALRISGVAGKRRPCSAEEKKLFDERFGKFRFTKGYDILWKEMGIVRDLTIDSIEPVNLNSMTSDI